MAQLSSGNKRLKALLNQLFIVSNESTSNSKSSKLNRKDCSNEESNESVNIVNNLSEIYDIGSLEMQKSRYLSLINKFSSLYNGDKPDFIIRSPGRVNIIGEHIDYCGYDVLPMTVEKDILFLCKLNNDNTKEFLLSNTNNKFKFVKINLENENDIKIDTSNVSNRKWTDYFLAGLNGVCKEYSEINNINLNTINGLKILVDGTLPQGSGLSSSSAFVCASAVSLLYSVYMKENKNSSKLLFRQKIAETCIECERNVGVDSGGMDQTICMMAEKGYAKHVSFIPKLNAISVKLPNASQYSFIILNCLKEHSLMVNAGTKNYNTRVVECRLATLLLAKKLNIQDWREMRTMRDVQDTTQFTLAEMIDCTMKYLHSQPYSLTEIEDELGINQENNNNINNGKYKSLEDFLVGLKTGVTVIKNLRNLNYQLPLKLRMLHVYSEALRVLQFADICNYHANINVNNKYDDSLTIAKQLGQLMCESHDSCDKQYDCSCDELNDLQSICMQGGALGSRLTGAGWGGCVVSLIEKSKSQQFKKYVETKYYSKIANVPNDAMFETTPSSSLTICQNLTL